MGKRHNIRVSYTIALKKNNLNNNIVEVKKTIYS